MSIIKLFSDFYTKPRVWQRVLVSIPLAFFLSHVVLFEEAATGTLWVLMVKQAGGFYLVALLVGWVLFAGEHSFKTYIRLSVASWWAILFQRIIFDNASGGVFIFQVSAFIAFTAWLAYAITGLQTNEFLKALEETKEVRKARYTEAQLGGSEGSPQQQMIN